ncbi:MAG: hypothetical protein IK064_01615, partial [Clostridia bacterium]|nr:hypothetical protein [Clostridia bacterium]
MKIRKLLAAALVAIMLLAAVPVASMAEAIGPAVYEAKQMSKLDKVWAALDAVEAKALAANMNRAEVINAVYQAALNNNLVDQDSFSDFAKDGFYFSVDGMTCSYNYRLRNELTANPDYNETVTFIPASGESRINPGATRSTCGSAGSANVLLVGPWYSSDSSFTDQYKTEAQSIANATGGSYTLIQNANATGPNIAAAYPGKGVIIYDSHGSQSGTTSYLCLTSSTGLTTTDYNNGWAINGGSWYGIDGRYIQNHVSGSLSNPFVWMAICEGMKKAGKGTTGTALLAAGCGGVYGYSQSVSFTGDYKYETVFWNNMKNGADVKTAITAMKNQYGVPDPVSGGDAYPIVMSPVDSFPSNPDSNQTVNCTWKLIGGTSSGPDALTSVSLANVNVYVGATAQAVL